MNEVARKLALGSEGEAKAPLSSLRFEVCKIAFLPIPQRTVGPCSYLNGERKREVKLWN